ncbi:neural cell adhesion molecule 2 [Acipenser oxyrinchus oxyrinchus]|uniref:Neural cell adhesion molecule 2 n=1 Tax=Acipenser oxyrinchus oxyrinchus TaxID=40147 RepID=A0AAD8G986_ACIOX|nr:neural cell adhesion molecule 2 [Acipenser oxyrinchus oxyrinchus]
MVNLAVLQVTISLSKVELSVGESKFFTCTVIGEPVSIEWFNPQGDRIVSSQRVVLQTESIRSRLTIYNANVEDAGIYRCQAANAKGQTQEATVVLEIYQKLTFRDVKTPQEFRQGEDAEIVCNVISSPVPIVTWIYNNREVTAMRDDRLGVLPNGNMQIQKVGKSDEGVYRCEARVEARGEIDFRDIAVIVNVPPVLTVPQKSFNATADRQELVSFICTASGSPEPAITWYRNGRLIEESDQYFLKGRSTELTVRNIKQSDGGSYSCRATNKAGTEEKELLLKVFVQPHITQLKNVSAVEGSQTQISCTAEGEPVPEISWRRPSNGQTFADGDKSLDGRMEVRGRIGTSALTISRVGLSDSGWFNCEAASRIGGHQKGMYLEIEYAPKFQSNQTIYYSWEGNPINVSCDVIAKPLAFIEWRRNKQVLRTESSGNIRIYSTEGRALLEVTPMSEKDFGQYDCTAGNTIGRRSQEYILAQADVPSNPYAVRLSSVSQAMATISFTKPDSHGGVPISYYQVDFKESVSEDWRVVRSHGILTMVLLTNLEPNTTYDVRVAAVNGKGRGEYSRIESFQTLPVREPSPPKVHGQTGRGKAFQLSITKQDDGGAPILEYIVKYRSDKDDQWIKKTVIGAKDQIILQQLQWNTEYEVEITALNKLGPSEPAVYQFTMPQKSDITDTLFSGLGLGAVVGLGVAALLLVLGLVDVSCFFLKQCGLLMCITRRFCGKKTATSSKSKDLEEGKAAYLKLPLKEENGKEALKPDAIEVKVHGDNSIQTNEENSKA